jgi:CheY-like chemotaxis protein
MTEALIIDDNRATADALSQMLTVLGFKSRLAYGSSAAMSILGSGFTPQFIFLDLNMPGVAGTEILAFLRREPRLIHVPVVVVTSDDQPETRTKVLKLGARAIILKPATIESLEAALKKSKIM